MSLRHLIPTTLASALLLLTPLAHAGGDAWETDFDAAQKKATDSGKDLLVDFSGSDWCGWCVRLDEEVFSKEAFTSVASADFVLVMLDFPRKPENVEKIPEEQRKRNQELQNKYGIRGFPSVLLMDAKGEVYARSGYQPGGPEAYLKTLAQHRADKMARAALQTQLEGTSGLERAKLLDQLVTATPADQANTDLLDEMAEIVKLDADNAAGLRDKYQLRLRMAEARKAMSKKDLDGALKAYDAIIADLKPEGAQLQEILFAKGEPLFYKKDMEGVSKTLTEALAAAPDGPLAEQIQGMLKRFAPKPAPTPAPAAE